MLVVVALNTIRQKKPFIVTPTGQPALYFVSATERGESYFNFNLGWSLSSGMGLAGVDSEFTQAN